MAVQGTYRAQAVLTANTTPSQSYINRYNASGGALSVALPALSGLNDGANFVLEKDPLDTTLNAVTFTRAGSDTFDDGSTTFNLTRPGRTVWLQVTTISATKYWSVVIAGELNMRGGITATTAQVAVTNTTTATDIITTTLPAGSLFAGSAYLFDIEGTIQTSNAASSSLTFTHYIQGTALTQTAVLASTGTANAASAFRLQTVVTVRSTGATGTAIAKPYGVIHLATTGVTYLLSTSTATTTINTLAAAGSTVLKTAAQWGAANASNSLLVETAFVERKI